MFWSLNYFQKCDNVDRKSYIMSNVLLRITRKLEVKKFNVLEMKYDYF